MVGFFTTNLHLFAAGCAPPGFFGLPSWYSYLQLQENPLTHTCDVVNFAVPGGFLLILLAVLDILLHLAGLVAIGFVIYGAIQYITSQGEPEKTAKAQSTIIDALIGLVIALISVGVVSFLGKQLG